MTTPDCLEYTIRLLHDTLQIDPATRPLDAATPLFGAMPEIDSMAVVTILTAVEDDHDISIDESELSAEVFADVGSLARFIRTQVHG